MLKENSVKMKNKVDINVRLTMKGNIMGRAIAGRDTGRDICTKKPLEKLLTHRRELTV